MKTESIDQIIVELEAIVNKCIASRNSAGYFAALYYKVTCSIRDSILKGEFEDDARMEKLDIVFARRYIDAWHSWQNRKKPTVSWEVAFAQTRKPLTLILQHLLLGINAHINLDLGIATTYVMDDQNRASLRRDFVRINDILSSLLLDVLKDIQRISPLSSLLGLHARNSKSMLINFTIESARDGAWCFAQDLSNLRDTEYTAFLNERDKEINRLGANLVATKGLLRFTSLVIRLFEWNNPAKVINVLKSSSKTKFNETAVVN